MSVVSSSSMLTPLTDLRRVSACVASVACTCASVAALATCVPMRLAVSR